MWFFPLYVVVLFSQSSSSSSDCSSSESSISTCVCLILFLDCAIIDLKLFWQDSHLVNVSQLFPWSMASLWRVTERLQFMFRHWSLGSPLRAKLKVHRSGIVRLARLARWSSRSMFVRAPIRLFPSTDVISSVTVVRFVFFTGGSRFASSSRFF